MKRHTPYLIAAGLLTTSAALAQTQLPDGSYLLDAITPKLEIPKDYELTKEQKLLKNTVEGFQEEWDKRMLIYPEKVFQFRKGERYSNRSLYSEEEKEFFFDEDETRKYVTRLLKDSGEDALKDHPDYDVIHQVFRSWGRIGIRIGGKDKTQNILTSERLEDEQEARERNSLLQKSVLEDNSYLLDLSLDFDPTKIDGALEAKTIVKGFRGLDRARASIYSDGKWNGSISQQLIGPYYITAKVRGEDYGALENRSLNLVRETQNSITSLGVKLKEDETRYEIRLNMYTDLFFNFLKRMNPLSKKQKLNPNNLVYATKSR